MDIRFLLGPAGSGKTFRCLEEIRTALSVDPLGHPLILLAPRQATYQLELQLLSLPDLTGYTRLQIISFERFAAWLLTAIGEPTQHALSEEGRVMVLRALLHRHHGELEVFGESGRSAGFARLLSEQLREVQQHRISPSRLRETAAELDDDHTLAPKLRDLALLLDRYQEWLAEHRIPDAGTLLDHVVEFLRRPRPGRTIRIAGLWLDGLADLTPQELELIAALSPMVDRATLAFCLESMPKDDPPWLSNWSVIGRAFRRVHARLQAMEMNSVEVEVISRGAQPSRFLAESGGKKIKATPDVQGDQMELFQDGPETPKPLWGDAIVLAHLEASWTSARVFTGPEETVQRELGLVRCDTPELEAVRAAREILQFVQHGNRFRDCAVLLRDLATHSAAIRRAFSRYDIPCFMDQRDAVAHHPLAELTRSALHTAAYHWRLSDWIGALKSELVGLSQTEVDRLENAALQFGWQGARWMQPLQIESNPKLARDCERSRARVIQPFLDLQGALSDAPTGGVIAHALRRLWESFGVETQLQGWVEDGNDALPGGGSTHLTVLEEMHTWLENVERAFSDVAMDLREWLPILETGLNTLTVGVIPPALDQVLIGAVDRSRNPELKLVIVPGLNEGIFPKPWSGSTLLTDVDRANLEGSKIDLRNDRRHQVGNERYFGYIAFTRAREKLLLTWAEHDPAGKPMNASPLVDHVRRLFPQAQVQMFDGQVPLPECIHAREIIAPLLAGMPDSIPDLSNVLPELSACVSRFRTFDKNLRIHHLSTASIESLHGQRLQTSASRLEQFAACPFQHFVSARLRAKERLRFEVDARKTGIFMHEALRHFHEELEGEKLRWRDITPEDGRHRMIRIVEGLREGIADGVFAAGPQNAFQLEALSAVLQAFVGQSVEWMRAYHFDPVAVELSIGGSEGRLPWWELSLADGRTLAFQGNVDRVDVAIPPGEDEFICLNVIDYKSGAKSFEPVKMRAGLQLQLPAYLAALCQVADRHDLLKGYRARPTGMFYVRLKDTPGRTQHRDEASETPKSRFQHVGRFSFDHLSLFDGAPDNQSSRQFSYRLKNDGTPRKDSRELVSQCDMERITEDAVAMLKVMGADILDGNIAVDPYRKGNEVPCTWCEYRSICRIDPWTHTYRPLRPLIDSPDAP